MVKNNLDGRRYIRDIADITKLYDIWTKNYRRERK
jgi:hypothetical protein